MGEFVRVAAASDIPPGEMAIVEVVAIGSEGGAFDGGLGEHRELGEGILIGDVVEGPFHAGQSRIAALSRSSRGCPGRR